MPKQNELAATILLPSAPTAQKYPPSWLREMERREAVEAARFTGSNDIPAWARCPL